MGLLSCFTPHREAGWGAPGFGDAVRTARAGPTLPQLSVLPAALL